MASHCFLLTHVLHFLPLVYKHGYVSEMCDVFSNLYANMSNIDMMVLKCVGFLFLCKLLENENRLSQRDGLGSGFLRISWEN